MSIKNKGAKPIKQVTAANPALEKEGMQKIDFATAVEILYNNARMSPIGSNIPAAIHDENILMVRKLLIVTNENNKKEIETLKKEIERLKKESSKK